jgi:hypothetical protein
MHRPKKKKENSHHPMDEKETDLATYESLVSYATHLVFCRSQGQFSVRRENVLTDYV